MTPTKQGSLKLFRFRGIDVHVHWSWFVVAMYSISTRRANYDSIIWPVLEYLTLFLIVLMHEFGHAFACRQVGGKSDQIVLWPLGGVAYIDAPQRPGATLWSIVAGPLVNLVLLPILLVAVWWSGRQEWYLQSPDLHQWIRAVFFINSALLIFNLAPVYPLDGGQIFRSLLWFVVGRSNSLLAASAVGLLGLLALAGLAVYRLDLWLGIMALFLAGSCWQSLRYSLALLKLKKIPRRPGFNCPDCGAGAASGELWRCGSCGRTFDIFACAAICPQCGTDHVRGSCIECGHHAPVAKWRKDTGV